VGALFSHRQAQYRVAGSTYRPAPGLQKQLPRSRESETMLRILGATMSEASGWDVLSRLEQRALIKLFGGGSLSGQPSTVVESLRSQMLVDEHDALSMRGLFLLTLAIRRQQGVVARRLLIADEDTGPERAEGIGK
jgi:hypothetical protein